MQALSQNHFPKYKTKTKLFLGHVDIRVFINRQKYNPLFMFQNSSYEKLWKSASLGKLITSALGIKYFRTDADGTYVLLYNLWLLHLWSKQ